MSSASGHDHGGFRGSGGGRPPAGEEDEEEKRHLRVRRGREPLPPPPVPSAPTLPMPSTESSALTDNGEELVKIVDPDELEARVLTKYVRSERAQRSGAVQRPSLWR